jgi:exodeoxyribonuclease VII small subunit
MDFEKKLNRLEEIVRSMEKGDLSLEDSLKNFEEGVKLSRECHGQLCEAEQKVQILLKANSDGSMVTEDFRPQD